MEPEQQSKEVTEASREAVHAQKNAAQAIETARAVQAVAMQENTTQSLVDALHQVFGEYSEQQRFIDTKRVPLICKQIENIHDNIQEIKDLMEKNDDRYVNQDQFSPVQKIVYGLVGLILTAVVMALIALVIVK